MSSQLQVSGEAKIRDIQGPVVANSGVITALDGAASQYVRGDGTLADFPTSTGGGSSVSYYLNGSINQGTFGGSTYYEMSKTPIIGAGTDFPVSTNGLVAQFITDANDPDLLEVPGGNFNLEFYFSVSNNTGNPTVYAELYKYDGATFTLLGSSQAIPESINQGTTIAPYYFAIPVGTAALNNTDRIAIRIYANVDGRTVTLHTENSHLCQVVTTFSKGLISLNNLTKQNQFFATGTTGTDFGISSSVATHTFNLPVASATNTGKLSNTDWSTFNNKQAALSFTAPLVNTSNTISIPAATSLVDGYLDNLDWVNFNTAYNNMIVSAAVTGTTTKTLTLTQQDAGTITASWTDDNTDAVSSVFGRTGAVVAQSGDYNTSQVTELTNLYFTDARSRSALSFSAGSGAYNSTTGVITIPTNNNQITNGSNFITLGSLSAGTGISYNNTTGVIASTITQYTDALARAAISGGTGISYNSTSGVITNTITQYTDALARASVSLTTTGTSGAATYNSTTGVFNIPNYGSALSGYLPLTGGTLTGALSGTSATFSGAVAVTIGGAGISLTGTVGSNSYYVMDQTPNGGKRWRFGHSGAIGGFGSFDIYNQTDNITALTIASTGAATFSGNVTLSSGGDNLTLARSGFTSWGFGVGTVSGINGLHIGAGASTFLSINQSTGALNGTSATFSGAMRSNGVEITNSANADILDIFQSPSALNSFIDYPSGRSLILRNKGSLGGLTLASTGAATFSSSVTAGGTAFINSALNNTVITTSDATNITNGFNLLGSSSYWGIRTSTNGNFNLDVFGGGSTKNALTIAQSSGNVGIGTASPSQKLEVAGVIRGEAVNVYGSTDPASTSPYLYSPSLGALGFGANGSERMRLTSGGNVLIGTTTDSGQKLQVNGITKTAGLSLSGTTVSTTQTITSSFYMWIFNGASGQTLTLYSSSGHNNTHFIKNSSANSLTLAATNIETLTSTTTVGSITIPAYKTVQVISNGGAVWLVMNQS